MISVSKFALQVIGFLLAIALTYILCQHLCKSYPMMRKYKAVTMVILFVISLLLIFQVISLVYPDFKENYEDLLEHITIPKKFQTAETTSIDMSAFNQKAITPATTTVIGGAMDPTVALMMQQGGSTGFTGYVPPTPGPIPTPIFSATSATGYTGSTGSTGMVDYTGYTGIVTTTSEEEATKAYTGYTGIVAAEESIKATPAPISEETTPPGPFIPPGFGPRGPPNMDMSNMDMSQILPFLAGLTSSLLTRQNVNVNVYGNGQVDSDGNDSGFPNPNVNKTRFDKCDNRNRKYNNDSYNYPNGRVRAYDEWKKRMDKDNDYVLMDQNTVNQRYRDPRKSSCPVCPLDINYPFSNYRSGR